MGKRWVDEGDWDDEDDLEVAYLKTAPPEYFLGGRCYFTVLVGDEDYTFRIQRWGRKLDGEGNVMYPESWNAGLLTGPDNREDYTNFARVDQEDGGLRLYRNSPYKPTTRPVRLLRFVLRKCWAGEELPEEITIQTRARCCRCGRMLTAPKSRNPHWPLFGPECGERS